MAEEEELRLTPLPAAKNETEDTVSHDDQIVVRQWILR